ncbi:MAG: hypothetical protein EOM87_02060 [Clostridia bacterium]|nr:hypothetical protein [Clostridia bacterium]
MSKELIIEKILADAEIKAAEIVQGAQKNAGCIIADVTSETQESSAKAIADAEALAPEQMRRKLSVAELEAKKILLKAKQEVLEKVFESAQDDIRALPKEKYLAFIKDMLTANAEDGDIVIISEIDKALITKAFVAEVAQAMGIKLQLSNECGTFKGGIILSSRCCNKNMTLELELATLREEKEAKIARMIFEEK